MQLLIPGGGTVATVLVVHEQARFNLVSLLTTSAVLTAIVGLAAQEPLKDLFAGLELEFDDVFSGWDFLDLGDGTLGVVVHNSVTLGAMGNRFNLRLDYSLLPPRPGTFSWMVWRNIPVCSRSPHQPCGCRILLIMPSPTTSWPSSSQGNLGDLLRCNPLFGDLGEEEMLQLTTTSRCLPEGPGGQRTVPGGLPEAERYLRGNVNAHGQ